MKSKILMSAVLTVSFCLPALAGHWYDRESIDENDLFRAHEVSVDLFGSLSIGQETINNFSGRRVTDDGRLGAGAGVNYFFTENFGIGADAYSEDTDRSFIDKTSASFIARLPLDDIHLAPYVFGGGGRQFDPEHLWFGQIGGGLEVRVMSCWGLFADVRYMFLGEGAHDVGLGRLGVRVVF